MEREDLIADLKTMRGGSSYSPEGVRAEARVLAAFDALRKERDCLHASQARYVGCGGMAYWICDECERVVGKRHRYIDGQESEWP